MFAVLGVIEFQVVGSPESLSDSHRYDYAELRVVQDRPRLQWLADELETIQLQMLFHRSFTDPAANLLLLLETAETHAALPLVFGNGDFRGYFVITQVETLARQSSAWGDPFALTVRVTLREWPFDPGAPPVPSFLPIGIVAAPSGSAQSATATGSTTSATTSALPAAGVSALLGFSAPTGPATPSLRPGDVPPSAIVRSG